MTSEKLFFLKMQKNMKYNELFQVDTKNANPEKIRVWQVHMLVKTLKALCKKIIEKN